MDEDQPGISSLLLVIIGAENQEPICAVRSRKPLKWTEDIKNFLYYSYLLIRIMETEKKPYSVSLLRALLENFLELLDISQLLVITEHVGLTQIIFLKLIGWMAAVVVDLI